jgi:glutathione S-transferase
MILWGTPHSLYTGKVRSYLIKKGLPFREQTLAHPRFQAEIVPAVRHMVVPVLELADGTLLQDSSAIIDSLEALYPDAPMIPATPVQLAIARLLDAFGTEALLAPAMHYRWSYRAEQESFLQAEFGRAIYSGSSREERNAAGRTVMDYFNNFLPGLGVTAETIPAIEASYEALLEVLDAHFQCHPYLLGNRPSIADFGFMAPLFAHLARDPVPAHLMKLKAPNVFRWTERMNMANLSDGEFPECDGQWLADDAIPATLEPVLALIFSDWGPHWLADAALFNQWVASQPDLPAGTPVEVRGERKVHQTLGMVTAPLRGFLIARGSAPNGLFLLDKALAVRTEADSAAAARIQSLVARTGGEAVMAIQLARRMQRQDFALVLA